MSIIYSYPEQSPISGSDMLIGTSTAKVGGKQKNLTKNFTVQQLADFVIGGGGVINPAASDFFIPVFNQGGTKITDSIISQNALQGATITIGGTLNVAANIVVTQGATIGDQSSLITLQSPTYLAGPIRDVTNILGSQNEILISDSQGRVTWNPFSAGMLYLGTWNANLNTTNGDSNAPALVTGEGVNGYFYIVDVAGTTTLDGISDWQINDWAVYVAVTNSLTGTWKKIDNTQSLTGAGTANTISMWTGTGASTVIGNSLISQDTPATTVTITGALTATTNVNAVNMTASGTVTPTTITDKDSGVGTAGQILSSTETAGVAGVGWIDNVTPNTYAINAGALASSKIPLQLLDSAGAVDSFVNIAQGNGIILTRTSATEIEIQSTGGGGDTYTLGSSTDGSNVKLNLDALAGSDSAVTLTGAGGLTVAQTNNIVTLTAPASSDTTYTLAAGAKDVNSVPLNLTPSTGSDTTVNLTEGTGITLTRNAAGDDVTITTTAAIGSFLPIGGGTLTGALSGTSAAFSSAVSATTFTGDLNGTINTLTTGVTQQPAVNDTTIATTAFANAAATAAAGAANYLPLSGGAMTGAITGLANPVVASAAANKGYVDSTLAGSGSLIYQEGYDAALDYPSLTTSPNLILQGWTYAVTAGPSTTFWNPPLNVGDLIIANIDNPTSASDWTEVQSNVGFAGSGTTDANTVKGIAGFNSVDFDVSTDGWVEAKTFAGTASGYVPISADPGDQTKFLKGDGTWATVATGTVTGSGTQYKVPLWSTIAGTALGDSLLAQDASATTVTLDGLLEVLGDGTPTGTGGQIKLNCSNNNHGVTIESPPHSAGQSWKWILPQTVGNPNDVLTTDGAASSQLSWTAPGASGSFLPIAGGTLTGPLAGTSAAFSSTLSAGQATFSGNIRLNGSSGELIGPIDNNLIIRAKPTAGNAAQGVKLWNNNVLNASFLEGGNVRFHGYGATPNVRTGTATWSLAVDSIGNIIQEPVGGDISGSGTGSSVTYFTGIIGDTGVKEITSNPNIVIDSTGRFGIGTDQPSHDLDVRNVISPPIINLQDANLNFLQLQVDPSLTTINKIKSNIDLVLDVDGLDAIKIDTAANVMIGDLYNTYGSATSRLHVIDEFATDILTLQSSTANQKIKFTDFLQPVQNDCFIGSDNGDLNVWLNYNQFGVSTPLFSFNKAGKLSVGHANLPNYSVDIQDQYNDANLQLFSQNTGQNLVLSASSSLGLDNTIESGGGGLQFNTTGTNILNLGAGSQSGYVKFNEYGQGNKTGSSTIGTPTYSLLVDAAGEIIEGPVSSGGGTIIKQSFTPSQGTTAYILDPIGSGGNHPTDANYVNVYIDGVYQNLNSIASVITAGTGANLTTTLTMVDPSPVGITLETISTI